MHNLDKREVSAEAAALFAASPDSVAHMMRRLEAARAELGEAYLGRLGDTSRPIIRKHVRRTMEHIDTILQALHDAGGRS